MVWTASHRYLFQGREHSPQFGYYYYRTRYFDPSQGRFSSTDTIGFSSGEFNLYRFLHNAPTRGIDPLGTELLENIAIQAPVSAVAGAINSCLNAGANCGVRDVATGGIYGLTVGLGLAIFLNYIAIDIALDISLLSATLGLAVGRINGPFVDHVQARLRDYGLGFLPPILFQAATLFVLRKVVGLEYSQGLC